MKLLVVILTAAVHIISGQNSFYHVNEIFGYLDTNADSVLTREELDVGCRTGRIPVDTWRDMFSMGSLSLSQFTDFATENKGLDFGDLNMNEIVQTIDTNKDGYIDQNEYGILIAQAARSSYSGPLDDTLWGRVTTKLDKNGDGQISWMEFKCGNVLNVERASDITEDCWPPMVLKV